MFTQSTLSYARKIARKVIPGEIRSLELQLDILRERKNFLPREIEMKRKELDSLPNQIKAIERHLAALRAER